MIFATIEDPDRRAEQVLSRGGGLAPVGGWRWGKRIGE
jgi:hypothetical protein